MMLGAQGASIAINFIYQLLLPPVFLGYYGIASYGEWLVLSATVTYLSSLNFGITTYSSNELTLLKQRGEMEQYRRLQASTLALLLGLIMVGTLASAAIAILPLPRLLHLTLMSRSTAAWTAFFLGLVAVMHILGGYYTNLYLVIQQRHRGQMWDNWRSFAPTLVTVPLAMWHASFAAIALAQFASMAVIVVATIVDLRVRMDGLPLSLSGADWATAKSSLKPSGMFLMIYMQNFMLFQVPVILLQRLLGPEIVVLFTISRTVFSMARRMLSVITNAIAPEITFSFGSGDLKKLLDIFHYSERVVFSLVPVANLGTFLCAPLLIHLWLHKSGLFEPWTYGLMALVSGVMSMREHKQFFQFSTNTHHKLAHIVFWGNIAMIGLSIPMTILFGVRGFIVTWLVSESIQMAMLYVENKKLFHADPSITMGPVLKLGVLMGLALPVCMAVVNYSRHHGQLEQGALGLAGTIVIFLICYWLFGLSVVQQRFLAKWAARRQASLV